MPTKKLSVEEVLHPIEVTYQITESIKQPLHRTVAARIENTLQTPHATQCVYYGPHDHGYRDAKRIHDAHLIHESYGLHEMLYASETVVWMP